ncbi:autotransporter outer membrane beta-barrel domain-containing protein [Rhodoplanes sp. Z2-YC6860]|uniref:autotransporter outer membrane beta-barrel domain-containing protein n=1 Tax=Rhodoplanes sp. Z2-YC6860 TaxID=674703 RepID=UPI001AECF49E|nr:autotransporter outer membrane beta-barrel domain-containing protein [Rhodoplanes sp. Z2-YC6860]
MRQRAALRRSVSGRFLALAALLAFALLATGNEARADCQPTAADGVTINCTTVGGTQTTQVGTGNENNVTVNVQNGATIDVSANSGASGINLNGGNTITNNGTIAADGFGAAGIFVNDHNLITNNGTINATGGATGINAFNGNTIINNGTIRVDDFGAGISVCCDNTVVNNGNIIGGDSTAGIEAGDHTNITNNGTIKVGSGGSYGIVGGGSGGNATIVNNGTIIAGDGSNGIAAESGYNIVNTGTISVGAGGAGILVDGGTNIVNSGLIRTDVGGVGVVFNTRGFDTTPNTLTNNGSIIATTAPGLAILGVDNNTVVNNGYIQGTILLLGSGNSLTNNGYLIAGDPAAYASTGPSGVSIGGTLTNGPAGTFAIRVDPTSSDSFVADTVQLNGRLQMVVTPGLYSATTTYSQVVFVCGCGGGNLTGTFSNVVSSSPFFTATADYSIAGEVDVTLNRIGFGSVPGMTPNQRAVGNVLEPGYSTNLTGNAATFYSNLLAVTSLKALDNLSGEGISGAQNAAFVTGSQFNNAMQTQGLFAPDLGGLSVVIPPPQYAATRVAAGHDAFASFDKAPTMTPQPGRFRIWTAAFGANQSLHGEADTGSSGQSVRSAGGMLGIDWQAAWDLRVGFAAGGSESMFSASSLATSGRMTGGHVGAFAIKTWGAYYAAATVSYAHFDNSTTRTILGVGSTETASGRFDSDQLAARFELGWKQTYGRVNVTPFVAVEPAVLWQRGFTETGANVLGLSVASHTATSLPTFVGVQVDGRLVTPQGLVFAPYSRVSWVHEFEPDRRVTAGFITLPGTNFTVDGARAASDSGRLDFGGKLYLPGGSALFANFAGEWSDRTETYSATGGFRATW